MDRLRRRLICGLWRLMLLFRRRRVREGYEWEGFVDGGGEGVGEGDARQRSTLACHGRTSR